jgi:hypothetical protein
LGGASSLAFPAASMAFALGVSLSSGASAQTTFNTNHGSTVNLQNYGSGNPFTVTTGTTISDATNDAIDGNNAVQWTLTNNGTVTGNNNGIFLQSQSTVTNAGAITGTNNFGIYLQHSGSVTNQAAGTISGAADGVFVNNANGTVTNAGTITGTNSYGVYLKAGGSVTNSAGGAITGFRYGVYVYSGVGTVTNAGTITASNSGTADSGVFLKAGSVTNQAGGSISSNYNGIAILAGGTVTNTGSITGGHPGSRPAFTSRPAAASPTMPGARSLASARAFSFTAAPAR